MANWFTRLFRSEPEQQKASETGRAVYMHGRRHAEWTPRNAYKFADEGYRKNVIAYQAINKIANAIAAIPWGLYRNGDEITEHPLLSLLERPNPMQSGSEFMRAHVGYYCIAGNAYMERVVVGQAPRELYTLRPDRMVVVPSETGFPRGYQYKIGSQPPVLWDSDPNTGVSDIRHFKCFNPLDDWYGLSPIEAGAYAVDQHNESMQWMQSVLQNGATVSGALEMDAGTDLGDDQYNRLKVELDEQYSGARNAGRPMLLEGGLKWTQMGLNPDQMQCIESRYASARDVSLALGVPPLLLNIPGDSTYNNYQEARLAFYEETAIPMAQMLRDELNAWLVPMFGEGLRLELELDRVPAIAEKRRELWTMADASQDLTVNERRELKGYEPITGGDDVLVSATQVPLNAASEPDDPMDQFGGLTPEQQKRLAGYSD